jgi:hypothetical protein
VYDAFERLHRVSEREHGVDRGAHGFLVDEASQLDELLAVRLHDEVGRLDALRELLGHRHDPAAFSQDRPRAHQGVAAHGVEYEIHGPDDVLEPRPGAVHDFMSTEFPRRLDPSTRCCGHDVGTRQRARWQAMCPTPPAAPWINTRCPSSSAPWRNSPCQAVSPAIGSAALSTCPSESGLGARQAAGTTVKSAAAPSRSKGVSANTASPTFGASSSGPVVATTPDSS